MATKKHLQKVVIWDTRNTNEEVTLRTPAHIPPQGGEGGLKQRNYNTKKRKCQLVHFSKVV